MKKNTEEWSFIIRPKAGWFDINLREIWHYKDLIQMFLKRNFNSAYKQTILGPLWFLINPFLSSSMYTIVFGKIANISTDGVPQFLFYLCSNAAWGYFSLCLSSTASTFTGNAYLFGKVYFPRLVSPITTVIYALLGFFIQMLMLAASIAVFALRGQLVHPNIHMLFLPVMILQMALLGLGIGIIISSVTTKYRDLAVLVGFGMQLWMYGTPVVYPVSQVNAIAPGLERLVWLNPVAPIINNFRYAILGCGAFNYTYWGISWIVTLIFLFFGVLIFSRVERTFMDTV
ncbi:MAG: ABC transporter permease [Clostridiales bacterium]|nr:ABC transporter permease [Clostridiales bacterium]